MPEGYKPGEFFRIIRKGHTSSGMAFIAKAYCIISLYYSLSHQWKPLKKNTPITAATRPTPRQRTNTNTKIDSESIISPLV